MSNYSKTTNFLAKDSLAAGDANKVTKGSEVDTEFDNISTASATKANKVTSVATTNNLSMLSASGDLLDSLVETDGSGNITANVTGNAATATLATTSTNWTSNSTITLAGDVVSSATNINGTINAVVTASLSAGSVAASEIASRAVGASEIQYSMDTIESGTSLGASTTAAFAYVGPLNITVSTSSASAAKIELLVNSVWGVVADAPNTGGVEIIAASLFSNGANVRIVEYAGATGTVFSVDRVANGA